MRRSEAEKKPFTRKRIIVVFLLPMLAIQTATLGLLMIWEKNRAAGEQISELTEVARGFYQQLVVTRNWNARHGGVYVEITSETRPNPYLDVPDRDIVSVNGKRYTKVNPAYMTRQLSEIAGESHGYWFRITALNPVNPDNRPDRWETSMLEMFRDKGAPDVFAIDATPDGSRIFKYFVPLKTEKPCLRCHEKYGSVLGDIRGGISIYMPMRKTDLLWAAKLRRTLASLLLLSAASMLLTALIIRYFASRLNRAVECGVEKEKLSAAVELAGAAAHEMRQPMTVVSSVIDMMCEKVENNEPLSSEEMGMIKAQCGRMNDTINKMLNITSYKTKEYLPGENIVDLDAAAKEKRDEVK